MRLSKPVTNLIPTLSHPLVTLRGVRLRDSRVMEKLLSTNRVWLEQWEATHPIVPAFALDQREAIRSLLQQARKGQGLPFVLEVAGEMVGQLNVSQITYGSLSSAGLGYWIVQSQAGRGITPTAVALATDHLFFDKALHRMEICIRPENVASLRVVEKLGFRFEGFRRRYIHINRQWRDHLCYALTVEEVPRGVLERYEKGLVPPGVSEVPEYVRIQMRTGLHLPPR
ncbi:MAG: GNAT family protein [Pontimonas sp.]